MAFPFRGGFLRGRGAPLATYEFNGCMCFALRNELMAARASHFAAGGAQ